MRVYHVIDSLDPEQGGPSKVILSLAAAQANSGASPDVGVFGTRFPDRAQVFDDAVTRVPGSDAIAVTPIDRAHSRLARLRSSAVVGALDAAPRPDVCHFHGFWDITLLRGAAWCRRNRVPYVITPHGMLDYWTVSQGKNKKRLAMALAFGKMISSASSVWALNAHEKRAIADLSPARRIDVVPNGVFLEEIDEPTQEGAFRAATPELGDAPFVLFLARLQYKKGLDYLARAWAQASERLPSHHLVIAGPREDDSIDTCTGILTDAGLMDRVHVVGPVYGAQKVAAYREASCFVLPSRQEGFSIAILEALALGAPCVISEACHFPEVQETASGLVVPLDETAFADAMVAMATDNDLRTRCVVNARRLVTDRYVWSRIAGDTMALYESAIKEA